MSLLNRMLNWGGTDTLQRSDDDGTTEDPFQTAISDFWSTLTGIGFSPRLIDRVWTASRCIHLNSQQIARMPLRFFGSRQPAWVSNPDPTWFPNGIGDAVYAAMDSMYRWGDAFLYITSRYTDGYPSAWTVLNAEKMEIEVRQGRKVFRYSQKLLDPANVVQVSRDPRPDSLRGTSAIKAYASSAYGLLAASDLGRVMMESGVPNTILQPKRKIDATQAAQLQTQWVTATSARRGAPAILPPDIDIHQNTFSPADLMLLDSQKFNGQVIASAFGVPALFVNLPVEGGLTYQSPNMLGEHWWRFELRPAATALSTALGSQMLPAGAYVEFDARDTLAPTFKDLVDAWATLAESGLVSGEELRAAVLRLPAQSQQAVLEALTTPPSAGASPAQQPPSVIELRPTTSGIN